MSAALYEGGACALTNAVLDCEPKASREGDGPCVIVSTGYNTGTTQSHDRCAPLHWSGTVLQCLSEVHRPDIRRARQVGGGAGQLEHAMVGACQVALFLYARRDSRGKHEGRDEHKIHM